MHAEPLTCFQTRQAHVAVTFDRLSASIGLGYVGLPLAVSFAQAGYQVTGIDLDRRKVVAINNGESYIEDVPSAAIRALVCDDAVAAVDEVPAYAFAGEHAVVHPPAMRPTTRKSEINNRKLSATSDFSVLADCDAVSICVPTPLSKTGDPDMSYIAAAAEQISKYLHPGMVIVLESTTYPGTTTEVVLPILMRHETVIPSTDHSQFTIHNSQFTVGKDFFLAFSPERVDPGRTDWTTVNTPKVMGGVTPACLEVAMAFYSQAIETLVPVSSPDAAEMVKLFENTFRMVNIGLANELLLMCDKLGLDAWEVIDAAATKPLRLAQGKPLAL